MSVPRDPYRKDPNAPKDFYARRVLPIDNYEYCVRTTWWFREMSRRSNGKVFFKNVANSADDVCLHIPASYRGNCAKFVQKYGSFLCNQAVNSTLLPVDICSSILEPLLFNTSTPASWGSGGCWHNSFSTAIYDIFQKDKHRFRKKHTLEELYEQTTKMQESQIDQLKYPEDAFFEVRKRYLSMKDSLLPQESQNDNNTTQLPTKPTDVPLWKMFGYMFLPHDWLDNAPPVKEKPIEHIELALDFTYQDFQKRGAESLLQEAIEKGKQGRQKWLKEIKDKHTYYTREEAKYMYNVLKAMVSDRAHKKAIYEGYDFDPELAEKLDKKRQKEIAILQNQIEVLEETIQKRERQVRAEKGLVPISQQELQNLRDFTEDLHFQSAEADITRFMQGMYNSEYPLNVQNEAFEDVPPGYLPVNQEYTKVLKKVLDAKTQTLAILEKHSEDYQNKKIPVPSQVQNEWEGYVASKLIWEDLQKNPQEFEGVPPSEIENLQKHLKSPPKSKPPPFIFGIDLATLSSDPSFNHNFPELVNVGHYQPPPPPTSTKK